MELEELKSKFEEKLGSTKLQLSEQTLSEVLQDALAEIGDDDTRLTDDFLTRKVNLAKKIDGQINFDVSQRIKDWEKQNPKPTPPITKKKTKEEDEEPAYFKAYREKMEERFTSFENERKQEKLRLQKESAIKQIKSELEAKFKDAGIEKNAYIFKQTLRDVDIPDEDIDISAIVKNVEREYYKNLKEAGFIDSTPHVGNGGNGGKGNKITNDFFARKAKREGWGNNEK